MLGHGSGFDSPGFREIRRVTPQLGEAFRKLLREPGLSLVELYLQRPRARGALPARRAADRAGTSGSRSGGCGTTKVVARVIGDEVVGTQGTPVELLGGLIKQQLYPELWGARNELTATFDRGGLMAFEELKQKQGVMWGSGAVPERHRHDRGHSRGGRRAAGPTGRRALARSRLRHRRGRGARRPRGRAGDRRGPRSGADRHRPRARRRPGSRDRLPRRRLRAARRAQRWELRHRLLDLRDHVRAGSRGEREASSAA